MKLDMDCVRDVMLRIETLPLGGGSLNALSPELEKYGEPCVIYTLMKLSEGGLVQVDISRRYSKDPDCDGIHALTFKGHQFLDSIRPATVWDKLQRGFSAVGTGGISLAQAVAPGLVQELLLEFFHNL